MGLTRSNNNGSGNFDIPPETDQLKRLESWKADPTLFTSGVQSGFDTRRRNIEEGLSPYSGVTNPYARNRMRDVELREAEGDRVAALADQDLAYQGLELQKLQSAAHLRQPERKQPGLGSQIAGTGLSIGASVATAAIIA